MNLPTQASISCFTSFAPVLMTQLLGVSVPSWGSYNVLSVLSQRCCLYCARCLFHLCYPFIAATVARAGSCCGTFLHCASYYISRYIKRGRKEIETQPKESGR